MDTDYYELKAPEYGVTLWWMSNGIATSWIDESICEDLIDRGNSAHKSKKQQQHHTTAHPASVPWLMRATTTMAMAAAQDHCRLQEGKKEILNEKGHSFCSFVNWIYETGRSIEAKLIGHRPLESQEFWVTIVLRLQSLACVSVTGFMATFGGINFNLSFSGQPGFYNGNFSVQEQVLAWKGTNGTYLFDTNPTNLKTDVTHGIQEAGLPCITSDCFNCLLCSSHKFCYKEKRKLCPSDMTLFRIVPLVVC
jgi:hypothetical protein